MNISISDFTNNLRKAGTYSGYKLQGRDKFQGMNISIENKKGSTRSGVDPNGKKWSTKMNHDYGYIKGTEGKDKDHLDCFLGKNKECTHAYVVHQVRPDTKKYDEDKVMLGFNSAKEAKQAYLSNYDSSKYFGKMTELSMEDFKKKALNKKNHGKMIKSFSQRLNNLQFGSGLSDEYANAIASHTPDATFTNFGVIKDPMKEQEKKGLIARIKSFKDAVKFHRSRQID